MCEEITHSVQILSIAIYKKLFPVFGHGDLIQCHILSRDIWDSHSTVAEDSDLQRCDTVWGDWLPTYL